MNDKVDARVREELNSSDTKTADIFVRTMEPINFDELPHAENISLQQDNCFCATVDLETLTILAENPNVLFIIPTEGQ